MKNVLITGGSSGIGLAAARHFYHKGYRVLILARNPDKLKAAENELNQSKGPGSAYSLALGLSNFAQVVASTEQISTLMPRIDILVLNAGLFSGRFYQTTKSGDETMMATTHLGHFLLTQQLLENLQQAKDARIVVTASEAHRIGKIDQLSFNQPKYASWPYLGSVWGYGRSKLANILFTREFAKRYSDSGITISCFHPGIVNTGLGRELNKTLADFVSKFLLSPAKAAEAILFLAEDPSVKQHNGAYFYKNKVRKAVNGATNSKTAHFLWQETERHLAEYLNNSN